MHTRSASVAAMASTTPVQRGSPAVESSLLRQLTSQQPARKRSRQHAAATAHRSRQRVDCSSASRPARSLSSRHKTHTNATATLLFHQIAPMYPGLQAIHHDPDIFIVHGFLDDDECDRLIRKAHGQLVPSAQTNYRTGKPFVSALRTSEHCTMPQREAPTIVDKLEAISRLSRSHFERLKIVRYLPGQVFRPHWDGYNGNKSGSGFTDSNRLLTLFCYLNSVDEGGETHFPRLKLRVKPVKGMAVVHMPATTDSTLDERCEHESCAAGVTKWILNCQMWADPKDEAVAGMREIDTRELSDDII